MSNIPHEVYLAAARAYCLVRYKYPPEFHDDDAHRERHIHADAQLVAAQGAHRAMVEEVWRLAIERAEANAVTLTGPPWQRNGGL